MRDLTGDLTETEIEVTPSSAPAEQRRDLGLPDEIPQTSGLSWSTWHPARIEEGDDDA